MILLYIYFEVYFLNPKGLSDGKVVSLTKKNMLLQFIFTDLHEIFKVKYLMNGLMQFAEVLFCLKFS